MRIRKATIKDFQELKKIRTEFYLWECKKDSLLNPQWIQRGLPIKLASLLRNKKGAVFVAEENDEIIGFADAVIEKLPPYCVRNTIGEVANLYVRPKFRQKGVAKKLLKGVLKWFNANGLKEKALYVYTFNDIAQSLYKQLGFKDYIHYYKKS